jgi:putative membrane protein
MSTRGRIITEASFDTKLRTYLFLQGVLVLFTTVIGILGLPFWWFLGRAWASRYFEHLSCTLTDRALVVRKGVWFRSESTVPLDRIQDVAIRHGPFLDRLGLATIRVETAGMGSGQGSGINLTGVVDTVGFRDLVLEARDRAAGFSDRALPSTDDGEDAPTLPGEGVAAGLPAPAAAEMASLLEEIRDSLGRIEGFLSDRR